MMAKTDADLVRDALAGSQDGYRKLIERYQRPVYSQILRMVHDPPLAEDLAQEVFIKAVRALDSYDLSRKFSSWLFKIAHNATIDHLRRRQIATVPLESSKDDEVSPLEVLSGPESDSPYSHVEIRDVVARLSAAVRRLKPQYREVVLLRFQQGLAYEEIAEITELPVGTVKTHLFRARKALAKAMAIAESPKARKVSVRVRGESETSERKPS